MTMTEVEAIRKAADLGQRDAMYRLGLYLLELYSDNVDEKNLEKTAEWFKKAAGMGHKDAQDMLDLCYDEMYRLGRCYETGNGRAKNLEKAACWYAKAECGSMKARRALFALQNPDLMRPCTQHYREVRVERRDYIKRDYEGIDYIVLPDGTVELLPYGRIPENTDRQTLDEEDLWGIGHFAREYGRFGSYPLTPDT